LLVFISCNDFASIVAAFLLNVISPIKKKKRKEGKNITTHKKGKTLKGEMEEEH